MNKKFYCFNTTSINGLYVGLSTLAILLGGMVYIFFRPADFIFFRWIRAAGFERWLSHARHKAQSLDLFLPDWIIVSLPSGLWAFSYALLIASMWAKNRSWLRYYWMSSVPLLVMGFELLQYPDIIPGTFCFQDLVMGMTGMITGICIGIKTTKPENHENAWV